MNANSVETKFIEIISLISLFFGISIVSGSAQTTNYREIDSLMVRQKIRQFGDIIKYGDSSRTTLYKLAGYHSLLNHVDSAIYYLNIATTKNYILTETLVDPKFENVRSISDWEHVRSKIINIWSNQYPCGDLDYSLAIIKMKYFDQLNRVKLQEETGKHGIGSIPVRSRVKLMKLQDSLNIRKLDSLIDLKGWPTVEKVGQAQLSSAFILILHADIYYKKKYLPDIEQSVEQGELQDKSLAYIIDKIRLAENKKQVYGTQLTYNKLSGKYELYPVEDRLHLNKRRFEVGLDSIETYLRHMFNEYNK